MLNPMRPCVGAVLALLLLGGPLRAGVLTNVGAIPNPFSPNADGVFDSTAVYYTLSDTAAVVVSVADSSSVELETIWAGWEYVGEHRHFWNGVASGAPVADGEYMFLVEAIPVEGGVEEAAFPFVLDTTGPLVADLDVAPSRFSPDGDGVGDSLRVEARFDLSASGDEVSVTVRDTDGGEVRLLLADAGVDSALLHWNGRDAASAPAADGLYYVRARTWDEAGNAAAAGALVDLDTAPPALGADLEEPDVPEIRTADTLAVVSGWAYDRAGVVDVEVSTDGTTWNDAEFAGPDTVTWRRTLVCPSCVPGVLDGSLDVTVRAHDGTATADGQGHTNAAATTPPALEVEVVFDVAGPLHESTTVQGGATVFTTGQQITITTRWDEGGYGIEADFGAIDSEFAPSDVTVTDPGTGTYTVRYTTSATNTLAPVHDGVITITATDAFERSAIDSSLAIDVLPPAVESAEFGVSENWFNPEDGASVTVNFGPGAAGGRVEVFTMAGTRVRVLESQDESAEWDGLNEHGEVVASGVYFLRIVTDDIDTIRKVAVVK